MHHFSVFTHLKLLARPLRDLHGVQHNVVKSSTIMIKGTFNLKVISNWGGFGKLKRTLKVSAEKAC